MFLVSESLGTTAVIDETAAAFEELVDEIIRAAEIETTMKRLLDEIESTKRRVNALEFKVIPPNAGEASAFIKMYLDEMERDELVRLKQIRPRFLLISFFYLLSKTSHYIGWNSPDLRGIKLYLSEIIRLS